MFAQLHTPYELPARQLDTYLDKGWFRMGQTIFTTNFLNFKNTFYSAIWLRISLPEFENEKAHQKLHKLNRFFRTEIKKAALNEEKEELFTRYRETVSFKAAPCLQHLLFGKDALFNLYDTYEVSIYDGSKLIACGYFDLGKTSAAGIASFYDPDYKKYSLGKYLIYLKINYCQQLGLQFFYPGYFVPGYSFFDYKLAIGKKALYFLNTCSLCWEHIESFTTENIPLQKMHDKLQLLLPLLMGKEIHASILYYDFFDARLLPELCDMQLLDYPIFLHCFDEKESTITPLVVYNVRSEAYEILLCEGIWKPDFAEGNANTYSAYLLKMSNIICTQPNPETIVNVLSTHYNTLTGMLK